MKHGIMSRRVISFRIDAFIYGNQCIIVINLIKLWKYIIHIDDVLLMKRQIPMMSLVNGLLPSLKFLNFGNV